MCACPTLSLLIRSILLCGLMSVTGIAAEDIDERLGSARAHLLHGRYDEAMELYEELEAEGIHQAEIKLGMTEICLATGRWQDAEDVLTAGISVFPDAWRLQSKLAELQFRRGRWDAAQSTIDTILKSIPDDPFARLLQAHLWTETGRLQAAEDGYRWFIRYYNTHNKTLNDAETLLTIAEGALQYARWKGANRNFDFVLNTLCIDALKADPNSWQSLWISGELLLEKYNRAQGVPELQKGLSINSNSAELHTAMGRAAAQEFQWDEAREWARKALNINPRLVAGLQLMAEAMLQEEEIPEAKQVLDQALDVNPHDQETLALLAVWTLQHEGYPSEDRLRTLLKNIEAIDKLKLDQPTPFEQIVIQVARRNPHPGYFLAKLGSKLEGLRQHAAAEIVFLQAIASMPQLSQPKTELGLLYMQTGKTDEARKLLDAAFKADPYHVRVSNMRKVLKVLDGYESVTTDHFVIRVDTEFDKLLARYMAEYLEEIYPELTSQFGYEPPARTQIEVYNKAKGLSAHQWFSARMIGLPWIQTIGASTGMIIAMASPTGLDEPLNWARVLKHEYVHILTLQQTQFHIPHWYTEALAVRSEGYPRPEEWNRLLMERVPKGRLRNLDNLNLGFQRAENRDDWNFSYCQSSLYAQYMVEKFGADATAKLLDAYRRQLSTDDAIPDVFGVSKSEFEAGYRDYLVKLVGELKTSEEEPKLTPAEITQAYEADTTDPTVAGRYAELMLVRNNVEQAKEIATMALDLDAKEPHAALVLAELAIANEDLPEAVRVLSESLDDAKPQRGVLRRLAQLKLEMNEIPEAARLFDLGRETFPDQSVWWKGTVVTARKLGETSTLKTALERLCDLEYDDGDFPLERAEIAVKEQDYLTAKTYGIKALHVDVLSVSVHHVLGVSQLKLNEFSRAESEFLVGLDLEPENADLQLGLAECLWKLKRGEEARKLIEAVLQKSPDHAAALELQKQLTP